MIVPTNFLFQALLGDLVAHVVAGNFSGALFGAQVGLYTNTPNLTQATVLADLTEPTFAGYVKQAITWSAAFQQPDSSWAVQGGLYLFQMSDSLVPTIVTGYFLVDSGGTHLLAAENFAAPIPLPTAAQAFLVSPQFVAGNTGWGAGTVVT
jgi:hypothetical protein